MDTRHASIAPAGPVCVPVGMDRMERKRLSAHRVSRSIRFRYQGLLGRLSLSLSGITRLGRVTAIGAPIVEIHPGSSISVGEGALLISQPFATALGVNHPVVLRTLRPDAQIRIGSRVGISGGSICAAERVEIGDDTMLGANVTVADTDFHSIHPLFRKGHNHPSIGVSGVVIGKRVFIGMGSIILKGVTIGDNSVIGAASVVTRSVPPNTVAAGNPCRVIRHLTPEELHGL